MLEIQISLPFVIIHRLILLIMYSTQLQVLPLVLIGIKHRVGLVQPLQQGQMDSIVLSVFKVHRLFRYPQRRPIIIRLP